MKVSLRTAALLLPLALFGGLGCSGQGRGEKQCAAGEVGLRSPAVSSCFSLTREIADRIQELLNKRFNPCTPESFQRSLKYQVGRLPQGAGIDEMDCFSTVIFLLSGKKLSPDESRDDDLNRLKNLGYPISEAIDPYQVVGNEQKINPILAKTVKPGDVLLFFGLVDRRQSVHWALYLGKVNGVDYVFQKPNTYCGESSPFEIFPLEKILKKGSGWPNRGNLFQLVFILRKSG